MAKVAHKNEYIKVNFIFPKKILDELTKVAGPRKRSPFVVSLVKEKLDKIKMLRILQETYGAWKEEDYPELATREQTDRFVSDLRRESDKRTKK